MSLRKWNDSEGYERGAKGIDGKKGEDYVSNNESAWRAQFGRAWPGEGKVKGEYDGK